MDASSNVTLLWLFLAAIPVGFFAVLIGASQFLSIPLFQVFFPWMSVSAIIGNLRIGSMLRDAIALVPLWKSMRLQALGAFILVTCLGSILGTLSTVSFPQWFLLPLLLLAVVITEVAPWITEYVHRRALLFAFFLTGIYYGMIGAGGSVISMAFLRIHLPGDSQIQAVRVSMLMIELCALVVSVIAFVLSGSIDWRISLIWAAGGMIGGYIAGRTLRSTGTMSPRVQKIFLRAVYVVAIAVIAWRLVASILF